MSAADSFWVLLGAAVTITLLALLVRWIVAEERSIRRRSHDERTPSDHG